MKGQFVLRSTGRSVRFDVLPLLSFDSYRILLRNGDSLDPLPPATVPQGSVLMPVGHQWLFCTKTENGMSECVFYSFAGANCGPRNMPLARRAANVMSNTLMKMAERTLLVEGLCRRNNENRVRLMAQVAGCGNGPRFLRRSVLQWRSGTVDNSRLVREAGGGTVRDAG